MAHNLSLRGIEVGELMADWVARASWQSLNPITKSAGNRSNT